MAARSCSLCSIHLPTTFRKCPICTRETKWEPLFDPSGDWEERLEAMKAAGVTSENTEEQQVMAWRIEQIQKLGYGWDEACEMAARRGADGQLEVDVRTLETLVRKKGIDPGLAKAIV